MAQVHSKQFHSTLMKFHFSMATHAPHSPMETFQHNRMTLREKGEIVMSSVQIFFGCWQFFFSFLYTIDCITSDDIQQRKNCFFVFNSGLFSVINHSSFCWTLIRIFFRVFDVSGLNFDYFWTRLNNVIEILHQIRMTKTSLFFKTIRNFLETFHSSLVECFHFLCFYFSERIFRSKIKKKDRFKIMLFNSNELTTTIAQIVANNN